MAPWLAGQLISTRTWAGGSAKKRVRSELRGLEWVAGSVHSWLAHWRRSTCRSIQRTGRPWHMLRQAPSELPWAGVASAHAQACPPPHRLDGALKQADVLLVEGVGVEHAGVARAKQVDLQLRQGAPVSRALIRELRVSHTRPPAVQTSAEARNRWGAAQPNQHNAHRKGSPATHQAVGLGDRALKGGGAVHGQQRAQLLLGQRLLLADDIDLR